MSNSSFLKLDLTKRSSKSVTTDFSSFVSHPASSHSSISIFASNFGPSRFRLYNWVVVGSWDHLGKFWVTSLNVFAGFERIVTGWREVDVPVGGFETGTRFLGSAAPETGVSLAPGGSLAPGVIVMNLGAWPAPTFKTEINNNR